MIFNIFILVVSGLFLYFLVKPTDPPDSHLSQSYMKENELTVLISNVNYSEAKSNV